MVERIGFKKADLEEKKEVTITDYLFDLVSGYV
jgi:hypothetical protein